MSLLSNLESNDTIEGDKDSVGGGSFLVDSGLHRMNIELAYIDQSARGALSLNLHLTGVDSGSNVRQTIWISSGDAKGNKNTYIDAKGKKQYLPGYKLAESLTEAVLKTKMNALETVEKVVNRWDFEAKAEIPQKTAVISDLLGKEILAGIIKQTVDKVTDNGAGKWVPSGEVKDENVIDKFFNADGLTATEVKAGADEGSFTDKWESKFGGTYPDKSTTGRDAAAASTVGTPTAATPAATSSLFANA
jgi:hypothetical protein